MSAPWARSASAYDNATVESFFAPLECELLDLEAFRNYTEARFALHEYIEGFYKRTRRHSSLGDLSRVEFERRWQAQDGVGDAA